MCRLLGIIANKEVDIEFSFGKFSPISKDNPDGWGIGWYQEGSPQVRKEPIQLSKSQEARSIVESVRSKVFILHIRKATKGCPKRENCHPFQFGNWLFAHNGTVEGIDALKNRLREDYRKAIKGETDSEVYFYWILQNIDEQGSVEAGIRKAIEFVRQIDHTGLNFLLTDGTTLYAYREAFSDPDYYSLYYLVRDPQPGSPVTLRSREVDVLLQSKSLNNERAVLVCSERLTEEDWKEISLRHLLAVSDDLSLRLEEI